MPVSRMGSRQTVVLVGMHRRDLRASGLRIDPTLAARSSHVLGLLRSHSTTANNLMLDEMRREYPAK